MSEGEEEEEGVVGERGVGGGRGVGVGRDEEGIGVVRQQKDGNWRHGRRSTRDKHKQRKSRLSDKLWMIARTTEKHTKEKYATASFWSFLGSMSAGCH